jgi:Alginate lyase
MRGDLLASSLGRRRLIAAGLLAGAAAALPAFAAKRSVASLPGLGNSERQRAVRLGNQYLRTQPVTVTSARATRSPGDSHAYYSEGDYWWPDPANPGGPYIRRDGITNPGRFDDHRQALIRLSLIVPALAAAFEVTGNQAYARAAERHLNAWFVDAATAMAPHLDYAQALIGINTGRGTGLIDTLHLTEVARGFSQIRKRYRFAHADKITRWFARYVAWMQTSRNGIEERDAENNHASTYVLQLAAFAEVTGDTKTPDWCRARFKQLINIQIATDGRQPLELARTKPFGYCLFNLDALAACAHLLSTTGEDLWRYRGPSGGSLEAALAYMAPFIANKALWPHAKDVAYWDDWPVRHPALLFGGRALGRNDYLALWGKLNPDPIVPEIIRNFPIRQPLLWR